MNRGKREKMSMWVAVGEQREEGGSCKCRWEWGKRREEIGRNSRFGQNGVVV
jgi:hypothetical protein